MTVMPGDASSCCTAVMSAGDATFCAWMAAMICWLKKLKIAFEIGIAWCSRPMSVWPVYYKAHHD
jgi:hypothetical protein